MGIIGSTVKPFTATAFQAGKDFFPVSEKDIEGKSAVFFFYPADFTFVCPTELEDLAGIYAELRKLNVEVFSVSIDTHFSHKAWHDTSPAIGKIDYYMVGDQSGQITNNFDVMRPGVGLADRGTFLVDPDGIIQFMEITSEGVGTVGVASAEKAGDNVTITFSEPVCPKNGAEPGQSSFWVGLSSPGAPVGSRAKAQLTFGGGIVGVKARTPALP